MTSYLPSASAWLGTPQLRRLTHTRTTAYTPEIAFNALSDVSTYHNATSLIHKSTVLTRDPKTGLAKTAKLTIGYPPLSLVEEWNCTVKCNKSAGLIEIRPATSEQSSVLETWFMKWSIKSIRLKSILGDNNECTLTLDMEVKFKGPVVDGMFYMLGEEIVVQKTMDRWSELIDAKDQQDATERLVKASRRSDNVPEKTVEATPAKSPTKPKVPSVAPPRTTRAPRKLEVRSKATASS